MKHAFAPVFVALALAGCASKPPHPDAFSFAVMGDAPYSEHEGVDFDAMLARVGVEPLAFVVYVGDFKSASDSPCTDALYADRRARLDASRLALVLTPGDNDWTDCRRESNGKMDPLDRLAKLREVFFADSWSLGRSRMPLARQEACAERQGTQCLCPGLPENRLWTKNGVVFATIHVAGSNDNRGFDAASDADQRCRATANRAWIEGALRLTEGADRRALVLVTHANPWETSRDKVYDALLAQVAAGARRLGKPLLFVHGDTHTYRVDRPFVDAGGNRVDNAQRLETFGSPVVGWVRVTVDPGDAELFRFEPRTESPSGG
ncbi:MAG: hypothetical protein IPP91_18985 [Betaproteobacteria bacterium]|nr:hypothetical protein [Betaproteobacteria bacterium]